MSNSDMWLGVTLFFIAAFCLLTFIINTDQTITLAKNNSQIEQLTNRVNELEGKLK